MTDQCSNSMECCRYNTVMVLQSFNEKSIDKSYLTFREKIFRKVMHNVSKELCACCSMTNILRCEETLEALNNSNQVPLATTQS